MEKPLQVLEIFNDFFGEDKVDMQGFPSLDVVEAALPRTSSDSVIKHYIDDNCDGCILVHFPHVKITNEYDKSTDINHLFAKVSINTSGQLCGKFSLNRSEYTVLHFTNGYMHSHISCIPTWNFEEFQNPCTGSGPINNTICSLNKDFDADLWGLFCLELDKYVQVESIAGTPYHRLEGLTPGGYSSSTIRCNRIALVNSINLRTICGNTTVLTMTNIADFIKYVIDSNILKFTYQSGRYILAMSATEYYLRISNLFIKWYNKRYHTGVVTSTFEQLLGSGILRGYTFTNGHIVENSNSRIDYHNYIGRKVCTFKGEDYRITISDAVDDPENNHILVLNKSLSDYIFTKIFNVINFSYGSKDNRVEPHKKIKFI